MHHCQSLFVSSEQIFEIIGKQIQRNTWGYFNEPVSLSLLMYWALEMQREAQEIFFPWWKRTPKIFYDEVWDTVSSSTMTGALMLLCRKAVITPDLRLSTCRLEGHCLTVTLEGSTILSLFYTWENAIGDEGTQNRICCLYLASE